MIFTYLSQKKDENVQNCIYKIHRKTNEAKRSSTHSFAYSYRLFKKCFVENYTRFNILYLTYFSSDLHLIFIVLSEIVYSFSLINLNLEWIFPFKGSVTLIAHLQNIVGGGGGS